MRPHQPIDWDAKDWLLVANALTSVHWEPHLDEDHAWELIQAIAADQDLQPSELIRQDI